MIFTTKNSAIVVLILSIVSLGNPFRHNFFKNRISLSDNSNLKASSAIEELVTFQSSEVTPQNKASKHGLSLHIMKSENEILCASSLCIQVFFGAGNNFWERGKRARLYQIHVSDTLSRWRTGNNIMVKAVDEKNEIVGYAEIVPLKLESDLRERIFGETMFRQDEEELPIMYVPKIANVAVHPSHRGMGVGREIMERCMEECKTRGYKCVVLEVEVDNNPARRFDVFFCFLYCCWYLIFCQISRADSMNIWDSNKS